MPNYSPFIRNTSLICLFCLLLFPGLIEAADTPLQKVTFMPQWVPQAQFAGYYVALETGIYRKYGLEVKIINGGPHRSSVDYLKKRKTNFASFWLVTGIDLCNRGVAVVDLAQIVQRSALMLIAKKNSCILKPRDMQSRKVGLWGPPFDVQPKIFFKKFHLSIKPIRQSYSINLFLRGGVDVASAMWYNEYHSIIDAGINPDELTTFFFSDYGLDYPEDGIYALQDFWRQKPNVCRAFVNASLEGWRRVFADPNLALDITMRNLKKAKIISNRVHQVWMLKRMHDIIRPSDGRNKMGHLYRKDFLRVVSGMQQQGFIQKTPPYNVFFPSGE